MGERWDGPRCWIQRDEFVEQRRRPVLRWLLPPRIVKLYEGGWHYTVEPVRVKVPELVDGADPSRGYRLVRETRMVPRRRLHLNDSSADEAGWFYELAGPGDRSWLEKHGPGNLVGSPLPPGEEHPPEAYDDHPGHGQYHLERGSRPGFKAAG